MGSEYSDDVTGGDGVNNYDELLRRDIVELLEKAEATATRRLELLKRGLKPLNSAEYEIWVEDVEKELADDND